MQHLLIETGIIESAQRNILFCRYNKFIFIAIDRPREQTHHLYYHRITRCVSQSTKLVLELYLMD